MVALLIDSFILSIAELKAASPTITKITGTEGKEALETFLKNDPQLTLNIVL